MTLLELRFSVLGEHLPADHGYALYSGLSRLLPSLHSEGCQAIIGPVPGIYVGSGLIRLEELRSQVRVRLLQDQIATCLPLAGKAVDIDGHKIRLGVPQVQALIPAAALIARLVVIKGFTEPVPFLDACRRQLDALGVVGEVSVPLIEQGTHKGKPRRHVMRVKDKHVVGFSVQITGLTAEESLTLQEKGLGGRKKMGCGFFVPIRERKNA